MLRGRCCGAGADARSEARLRWLRARGEVLGLALAVLLAQTAWPPRAEAHARMLRSIPADGATLGAPPQQIELWFNEILDGEFNRVEVFPAAAESTIASKPVNLVAGAPSVDARDPTHLVATLTPLAPGDYVVRWRVLSRDGHTAFGRARFRVGTSSAPASGQGSRG